MRRPRSAPLAKWTALARNRQPQPAARPSYAAMSKVATRQSRCRNASWTPTLSRSARCAVIDLDPTPSLVPEGARLRLFRGAARVAAANARRSRAFREIAGKFDAAVDAMEWLVGKGCSCGDASRSWEAVARGYLDPNFDVARSERLAQSEAVSARAK